MPATSLLSSSPHHRTHRTPQLHLLLPPFHCCHLSAFHGSFLIPPSLLLLPPHPRRVIVNSAKLIAEKIERNGFDAGYDWCVASLRDAGCTKLANEVHLAKASKFLANKEFEAAIGVFKVRGRGGRQGAWGGDGRRRGEEACGPC